MALGEAKSCHGKWRSYLCVAENFHSSLHLGGLIGAKRIDDELAVRGS